MRCHTILTNRPVEEIRPVVKDGLLGVRVGTLESEQNPLVFIPLSTEYQQLLAEWPPWVRLDRLPRLERLDVPDEPFNNPLRLIGEREPNANDGYALVLVRVRPGWAAGENGMRGRSVPIEYTAVPYPEPLPFPPPGVRCVRGGVEPEALFEMAPGSRIRIIRGGFVGGGWKTMDIKNEGDRLKFYRPDLQQRESQVA
jgi:hypothetical protein